MTHLFYIHSNITLLSSLSVIEKYNLSNVVFLFGRGFNTTYIKLPYRIVVLSDEINKLANISTYGIFKPFWLFNRLQKLDSIIHEEIKSDFELYLPHTKNFLMQILLTSKYCKKYNIIDEGMLNYSKVSQFIKSTNFQYQKRILGIKKSTLKFFSHFNRSIVYKVLNINLNKIYLFNKSDYENFSFEYLTYPNINIEINNYDNATFFLFDNSILDGVVDQKDYFSALEIIFLNFGTQKIFIKFHPAEKQYTLIVELLNVMRINYEILPNDIPLEIVFLKSSNLKIYGIWSSLLFYASIANQEVYSYVNTLSKISEKANKWTIENMPDIFYKKIKIL